MLLKKNIGYTKEARTQSIGNRLIKLLLLPFVLFHLAACSDFVEVDLPQNLLAADAVFEDRGTATAALAHIYTQMREAGLSSGLDSALNLSMGFYADELDGFGSQAQSPFYSHSLLATDDGISRWWATTYNLIYAANALVEGVGNSVSLAQEDQDQLMGEGLFVRAYLHSLLVQLFGDVPYIRTKDFVENTTVARMPVDQVYENIIADLIVATDLLSDETVTEERVRPYRAVANALLARVYLYSEQWEAAATAADKVIGTTVWEPDLDKVFLRNSSGSLWQLKPNEGGNTIEANVFIPTSVFAVQIAISAPLLAAFEPGDQRRSNWIGSISDGTDTWYYPLKYKEDGPTTPSLEYSVLFRLAEQYLIRAEARAQLGNITGAQSDINTIRTRAGLGNTPAASSNDLLNAILQERRVELFTEFGQRWFDLKRTGRAAQVLAPIKLNWRDTDILLPIPEAELFINPNLLPQNDGY